jgi:hypothetical protein
MPSKAWLSATLAATAVALVPAIGACGPIRPPWPTKTVTATTPTTSQQDAIRGWWKTTQVPAQELRDAFGDIAAALDRDDPTRVAVNCQKQDGAVEQFQQKLPSPDPALTAQLQKALEDYDAAAQICTTAIINHNYDDLEQAGMLIREGNTYMDNAIDILHRDLGESSDTSGRQGSFTPSYSSSPATASAQAPDSEQDSVRQLQQLASSDRPFVQENLAGWWIPQLSSKSSTEPWTVDPEDGVTYDPARILSEHQLLRQKYPGIVRLLWAGNWSTFSAPNFWVTVVADTFPESAGALAWCTSHGFDRDHCTATHLEN